MLLPLRSQSSRQCRGVWGSGKSPPMESSTEMMSPRYLSAISFLSVLSTFSDSGPGTICAVRFDFALDAASISRASTEFMAIRASQSTCLSFSSAATVSVLCRYGQVPMQMALVSGAAIRSCQLS